MSLVFFHWSKLKDSWGTASGLRTKKQYLSSVKPGGCVVLHHNTLCKSVYGRYLSLSWSLVLCVML